MVSIEKIKRLADTVAKNTVPGSNTNTLIGNLLKAITEYMAEQHHGAVGGYQYLNSIDQLPTGNLTDKQRRTGYVIGDCIFFYVGTGGDTLDGEYQNGGSFHGTKGDDGLSAYEIWKAIPGNENKSIDDFWAFLTADKGYTKQVLTYAEFQALDPTTVSRSTIYVHPNSTNTEYYAKVSNGNTWVVLLRNNGDITDLVSKIKDLVISVSAIKYALKRKADLFDTEEDGVFFANKNGEVFLKFDANGLDVSKVSEHLKLLVAQDLAEYAKLTDIPEQLEVIKTTEENGIYFTDGQGNVFIKYDNVNGLDVNKVSEHLKSLITEGLIIPSNSPIEDIEEDIVSLVTNENGESAVLWSDLFGFNANKVNYDFVKLIKNRKIKDMEEYSDLGVGMFIHWGIYSTFAGHFTGTNIDGDYVDTDISEYTNGLAEWAYRILKIPDATYKANESLFTDENWDADAIAKMAYDCGFGHIVITAKHHEGFTLYDSQFANWNISTSGASGKDPLMELKKACEKYGLKFCLYFSQAVDWMAEGGFAQSWKNNGVDPYTEDEHWDYVNMTANILKEMVDRYNPYVIWYDQPAAPEKYAMIFKNTQLKYYPQVIVNWRLMPGFVFGDFATGETIQFQGDREKWKYAEGCFTLDGGSWGYQESADDVAHTMLISHFIGRIILQCKCRNQNALANIGPKADGSVSEHIKDLFGELSTYVQRYGTFKDTRSPNIHSFPNWGKMLKKGKTLKLYVLDGSTRLRATPSTIKVDGIQTKFVKRVRVYDAVDEYSSSNYDIVSDETMLIHNIPFHNTQDYIDLGIGMTPSVVDIEFDNDIVAAEYSNILDDNNLVIGALAFDSNKATIWNGSFNRWDEIFNGSLIGFRLGGWNKGNENNPTWVETNFKFDGTSGSYNANFLLPNGRVTDPAIATAVFTDIKDGREQSFTFSRVSTTSSTSVYLEKGKTYKLRMMHDGGTNGTATLEFTKMTFSLTNR